MKYLGLAAAVLLIANILSFFDSKYEKLSPPGKFNPSFQANLLRNILTFGAIVAVIALMQVWF